MSKIEEFIKQLKEVHLDIDKMTRALPKDNESQYETYNPASDVVNIFPVALSASINDLIKLDIEHPEKVEYLVGAFIDKLTRKAFIDTKSENFEKELSTIIKNIEKIDPEMCQQLYRNMFINMFFSYFVATKFGLRSIPTTMCGKGAFQYFALLDIFDNMPEELQDAILDYFGEQGLWGVVEDGIE